MGKKKNDYYAEIDKALESYEHFKPYHTKSMDWICNRIDWCWRFRHISRGQLVELTGRACAVLDFGLF